jgi:hypothetical protein
VIPLDPDPYCGEPVALDQVRAVLTLAGNFLEFACGPGGFDFHELDEASRSSLLKIEAALGISITPAHGFDHAAFGAGRTVPATGPTRIPGVPDIFDDGPEAPPRGRFKPARRIHL